MGVKVDFKVNVPHGEMDITENGQYDVSDYAIANVNVAFETEEKSVTITENGTQEVLPSVGKDALSKVVINTEIPIKEEQSKNVEIKQNGTISVLPDEGKVLNEVSITTNVPQDNTLKKLLDARKSASYLFYQYKGDDINTLIQYNDTSEVTDTRYMFYSCNATTFPLLNMSKVKNAFYMFYQCSNMTTAPLIDLSKVQNCESAFRTCLSLTTCEISDFSNATNLDGLFATCRKLKNIPSQLTTPKVTDTGFMFYECNALETAPEMNTSNVTNMTKMFYGCDKLITVPLYDTSKVTRMEEMFWHCSDLQTVPAFDCSNVTNMNNMFASCRSLKSILMTNIGVSLNISSSTLFERSDLLTILNNLQTVTSTEVLTMGATNLAKLTDEDKAIATNKGWTLA